MSRMSGDNERNVIVNVRFTEAQMNLLNAHALSADLTVSALVREAVGHYLFNGPMPNEGRRPYRRRAA